MKRIFLLILIMVPFVAGAHTPLLVLDDNGDGTIYIEAGFSNGASAAGTDVIIKSKESGTIFWEGKVGEDGYVETEMPSEPYTVTLDAGPGHVVTKDGPEPQGGFGVVNKDEAVTDENLETEKSDIEAPSDKSSVSGDISWTPSKTMGAIPPTPPTIIEILMLIFSLLQLAMLAYIAIILKRNK